MTAQPNQLLGLLCRELGVTPEKISFGKHLRGTAVGPIRERMEQAGRGFLAGYDAALQDEEPDLLAAQLDRIEPGVRGFAYEGAGLGLAFLDALAPWRRHPRNRLARFLEGPGSAHVYILHIGAGWLLARPVFSPGNLLRRLDPLLCWLAVDGLGFHHGFFRKPRTVARQQIPRRLAGYARRAFDLGVGRSFWFTEQGPEEIRRAVAAFPAQRQGDLWSGAGEACAFAGGRGPEDIEALRWAAGPFAPHLAQGAAFAAEVSVRSEATDPRTELACEILCRRSAAEAAAITRETRVGLPPDGEVPAFEIWRRRIQERFSG